MAKLGSFKVNAAAIEAGAWVKPGEEFDDLEIKTRGFTNAYNDAREAKLRKAALAYGGDTRKIPSAIRSNIITDCMIDHLILDVRGLVDDAGAKVDFPAFCSLLRSAEYAPLVNAAILAAAQVGNIRADDLADATGN